MPTESEQNNYFHPNINKNKSSSLEHVRGDEKEFIERFEQSYFYP